MNDTHYLNTIINLSKDFQGFSESESMYEDLCLKGFMSFVPYSHSASWFTKHSIIQLIHAMYMFYVCMYDNVHVQNM